jgi:predicted transcriptional regulator
MPSIKQRVLCFLRNNEPMLSMEIAKELNLTKAAASEATKELYLASKIHVVDWRPSNKNGGNKVYAYGKGEDAPKPVRSEKEAVAPFVPHADVAAAWLRNPI